MPEDPLGHYGRAMTRSLAHIPSWPRREAPALTLDEVGGSFTTLLTFTLAGY